VTNEKKIHRAYTPNFQVKETQISVGPTLITIFLQKHGQKNFRTNFN
jgi:hypothetical protein